MTTAYLDKALWCVFHTRPKWRARAWNNVAGIMTHLQTSLLQPVKHLYGMDGDCTGFIPYPLLYICLKFPFDLGIHKQRMQKNYIDLGSKQGNTHTGGHWATRSNCVLTIPHTRGVWSQHWQHRMPLAANALCAISRDTLVWTLPMALFPRNEQKKLHHFS